VAVCSHSNSNLLTIPITQIVIRSSGFSTNGTILSGYSSVVRKSRCVDISELVAVTHQNGFTSTIVIRRANLST